MKLKNKSGAKRYALYLLRWQLSTLILAPVIALLGHPIASAVVVNLIGGAIFYWVDRIIFKGAKE